MQRIFYFSICLIALLFSACKKKSTITDPTPETSHSWSLVDEGPYYTVDNETLTADSDLYLVTQSFNTKISKDGVVLEKIYHQSNYSNYDYPPLSPNYFITYNIIDTDLVATFNPINHNKGTSFLTTQDMVGFKLQARFGTAYSVIFLPMANQHPSTTNNDSGIVLIQYHDTTWTSIQLFVLKYNYQANSGQLTWTKPVLLKKTSWFTWPRSFVHYKNTVYFTADNDHNLYQLLPDYSTITTISLPGNALGISGLFSSHDTLFANVSPGGVLRYTVDGNNWAILPLKYMSMVGPDLKSTLTGGFFTNYAKLLDVYQNIYLTTNTKGLNIHNITYLNVAGNYAYAICDSKLYKLPLSYLFEK